MAELVGTFGTPHTPLFPLQVAQQGAGSETGQLFAAVRAHLDAVRPDVLVVFDSDHLNTFFLDNLPTFAVGCADSTSGPNDQTPGLPAYQVPVDAPLGTTIYRSGIHHGFDLSLAQEFTLDHSILVPLHFLTPAMQTAIVPVFINGLVAPLPLARRCYQLGQQVRASIDGWPSAKRVAVLASGSFSLEVNGPRVRSANGVFDVPDLAWMDRVVAFLRAGHVIDLLNEATEERMLGAGNVAGELLNWIALLGVIGDRHPVLVEPQASHGHAYAAWRWD
jgi:catalytic LigB subunit of aromatic ring-opening dioxygenase